MIHVFTIDGQFVIVRALTRDVAIRLIMEEYPTFTVEQIIDKYGGGWHCNGDAKILAEFTS